jgi:hypothetical protein
MRTELIRCDICKKEHDAQYQLPREWVRTKQRIDHYTEEEKHFCCKECLVQWATTEARK